MTNKTLISDLWRFIEDGDHGTDTFFALRERVRNALEEAEPHNVDVACDDLI